MNSPAPPPPGAPRGRARAEPSFDIPGLPKSANLRLTEFFGATEPRRRFYRLLLSLLRHHSLRSANAIAFDLFLALVPMLGLAGWTVSHLLTENPNALISSSLVLDVTPYQFRSFIEGNLQRLSASQLAPIATFAGWWLSSSAFFTLISVFEESFDCEVRPYWQTTALSMGFAFSGFVLLALAGASGVALTMQRFGALRTVFDLVVGSDLLQFSMALGAFLVATSYLAFVYRYSVRRRVRVRRIWPGAFLAAGVGSGASFLFAYYASRIATYALFYGGLAAVAIALLWLWLWCTAILIGAEVNIALEDTTETRLPIGAKPEEGEPNSQDYLATPEPPASTTQTPRSPGKPAGV